MVLGPEATGAPRRVFIYGSCVSRDAYEVLPGRDERHELTAYVARQSLLSAGHDATGLLPEDFRMEHAFQERMVRSDWAGDVMEQLDDAGPLDLLVWDLVDERHGAYWFLEGGVVTRSVDIMGTGLMELLPEDQLIGFGSGDHLAAWSDAAAEFAERLRAAGLFERTVVLEVPWAEAALGGEPVPPSMGLTSAEANRLYRPYYARLRELGFDVLSVEGPVHADPEHKWGLAPFHYAPEVYERIDAGIAARLGLPAGG
ncbi:DUF6270 domain-containing protein [Rothia sp. AR01]|uniref:DUF6270 domain-containing protein n=1 Tax=Rothia santali TaxID=2949643 RepID=A0A9X2HJQ5_9MICC|nr:DUF6270 domain-containing protein [Rothia santali]MCP3426183.1 DUF6270 domain-containing protein [Rothia santali]